MFQSWSLKFRESVDISPDTDEYQGFLKIVVSCLEESIGT